MKRETRLKFKQLKVIIVAWMIVGFCMSVYDHLTLLTAYSAGFAGGYSFALSVMRNVGAGLVGALLGGSFMVFYVNTKFNDKPYGYTVVTVIVVFILVVSFISFLMGLIIVPVRTGRSLSDPIAITAFKHFLQDSSHLKAALGWSFVVGITQLLLQVNSKFGQSNFWNIIRGKYNQPKGETRIFMFLDINQSTSIAEKIGDERYHTLLKDFFADITGPVLENKGSIYQYVGDEVVIAWNYEDGKENLHCVRCFFDLKLHIEKVKQKYLDKYGLIPSFKAGIHCGQVIAGEIGIIKRDITYSGDVLNTTSRILDKCGELKEEIIVSSDLLFQLSDAGNIKTRPLGTIKLRGKEKEILLSALSFAA